MIDVNIKKDFPILSRLVNGKPVVYLDNGATSQKPEAVINAISDYYKNHNANVHRGVHVLAEEATELFENSRKTVAEFIGARKEEIVFVRNTTEAINLVAYAWGRKNVGKGDSVATTIMEHHSNFVPWQQLAIERGAEFKVWDINKDGTLDLEKIFDVVNSKTKILAVTHVSNVTGVINDVKEIVARAKRINPSILVLVDGAQAVPHMKVNVSDIGADFYAFSGHKMMGPMGIGVLFGKKEVLENMPSFLFGGSMIREVSIEKTEFLDPPTRFEAGTPDVAGTVGLTAAIDYLKKLGMDEVRAHEKELTKYCLEALGKIEGVTIYGPLDTEKRAGVVSFNYKNIHSHDVAQILDSVGVCVRSGHHCAMPLHTRLGASASTRASFYVYNTKEDIDRLAEGLEKVRSVFKA